MMLNLRYNFLFVHTAKTGGTSIRSALQRFRWRDPWSIPQLVCSRMSALSGHRLGCKFPRHAKLVAAYEMLPRDLFRRLFKFVFVRNPWDLQVSSWHHIRRERPHLVEGLHDFDAFLRWKLDPQRPYHYIVDTSMELQSDYIVDLRGAVLVDFIGRYERLTEDFAEACRRIGIRAPALPHKRRAAGRGDYRRYYTAESAGWIAGHFQRDIEMFGYRFEAP
jgi:hypothetical protein